MSIYMRCCSFNPPPFLDAWRTRPTSSVVANTSCIRCLSAILSVTHTTDTFFLVMSLHTVTDLWDCGKRDDGLRDLVLV